ncbi:hypothetical protein B0T26DRAFT_658965 [Lasiosphaeria miniovina]|uniref:mRNA export factor MEX67 n=1 Tax=Lasiosphaeria miniovina TaxID=1954250 RepID=A0AA39ZU92_9PEZI|nr:uncharacterized protein B0T26DRAFT_658965 [Lasiosphaeria miniovina]KAK0703802.1 hypothetical protein B0T26DRAFT_658965 [Lasiosphaeria miniovina]
MAPPTGPRGNAHRSVPRGSRGGGITKRRGTPITDKDGDVAMDVPATGSGTSGAPARDNRGARGGKGASTRSSSRIAENIRNYGGDSGQGQGSKAHFNRTTLKILGLRNSKAASNNDGGLGTLVNFIQRKASKEKPIRISKSTLNGDYAWISVNKDDAPVILRLNGFVYAGATLEITETTERMPNDSSSRTTTEETKKNLLAVLGKRYHAEQKLLDLSALGTDEGLSMMGAFGSQSLAEKAFKALLHLATSQYKNSQEKNEAIEAVSLARNDINDVQQVFTLVFSLPDLKRLDLSGNHLDSLPKIAKWEHRFQQLQELHLTDNPIMNQDNFVPELLKWFPSLQILNGQQVRAPEEIAESLKLISPTPIAQFPSNLRDGENNVASAFLSAFFILFDSDRARLASEFYDDESWFSVSVIPNPGRTLPWKSYLKFSRNVNRVSTNRSPDLLKRIFTGGDLIAGLWALLPSTRHPSLDQPGQWLIDCHTFPGLADPSGQGVATGLAICVNGQFEEADTAQNIFGTRTFSRTFILGPSNPANPRSKHPYRVISDQLTLHNFKANEAVVQQVPAVSAMPTLATVPTVAAAAPVPNIAPMTPDAATKAQLIQELSSRTNMTAEYSELCLGGAANWNFDLALESFEKLRATLPPDAFLPVA